MKISAVILAAGEGSRLGGVAKALLVGSDGRTFLRRIVETAREVGVEDVVVVVGPPHGDAVAVAARELGATVVVNPEPARGMASSVALGFAALADRQEFADVQAAWLWPVDHPDVSAQTLRLVMPEIVNHVAVRPVYEFRGGHPPLIARSLFPRLASCTDVPGGARSVLAEVGTHDVPVDDPGCARDVDTVLELEQR